MLLLNLKKTKKHLAVLEKPLSVVVLLSSLVHKISVSEMILLRSLNKYFAFGKKELIHLIDNHD